MSPDPKYDEPFAWWGPAWQGSETRDIAALLRDETIDSWTAANLWAALARRRSLVVVSSGSEVGKTTLLSALLDFLPPNTRRVYLRGCFESFAFLSDPTVDPSQTALLINEISPHLPVYLWGSAVSRVLETTRRGFALLATAHADSVNEFVGTLCGSPLRIPLTRAAAFEFVVVMKRDEVSLSGRRVHGVWRLEATREGVAIGQLPPATETSHDISQKTVTDRIVRATWFPLPELLGRQSILDELRARHGASLQDASLFFAGGSADLDA